MEFIREWLVHRFLSVINELMQLEISTAVLIISILIGLFLPTIAFIIVRKIIEHFYYTIKAKIDYRLSK